MNKKIIFVALFLGLLTVMPLQAQRGVRIGYIDMEYLLSQMSSYQKAVTELEEKSKVWKDEISQKQDEIQKIEDEFAAEKPLLTPSLIEERVDDLEYEKNKLNEYQQKRFGPQGDWFIQQQNLLQPIQDQVLSIVQQIADKKKYDFVFDRTSDVFMLYSEKKYDISELVLKNIKKAERLQNAEQSDEVNELILEDESLNEVDPEKEARKKELEQKKAERAKRIEEKKAERARIIEEKKAERARVIEEKRKAYEAKKLQIEEEKRKAYEAKKKAEREADNENSQTEK
ncbi:MAG: OmpH family outer membrane protein [Flavobacteriaceae bacterium]|mgnify:CR=1 FL=1|jgi:Skp family chaperone for outer membrane proteins|nr:OmpH family outer membrane protein [Flavobacteriaceae bacterium]MDG2314287.1 OmpH family outer membrane protein [Flavobacteriaceae bacterium]